MGGCKGGLGGKLAQKEKLGELECTGWWYQWLGQALLIMAERSVVLAQSTFGSCVGPLQMNRPNFLRVRGEQCPRPLMTNTAARQGSDKSPEKEYGETQVTACVNHRRREAQSHNLALTLEQE